MATANASQFIGSKISLISKSEIRYEGILYSLDVVEATISLAKVKSYGTEDRPTDKPCGGRDEIYEFIIFRGADIKGIDVVEPPKSAATLHDGIPNDPAIVEVSHYHSAGRPSGGGVSGSFGQSHSFSQPSSSGGGQGTGANKRNQGQRVLDGLLSRSSNSRRDAQTQMQRSNNPRRQSDNNGPNNSRAPTRPRRSNSGRRNGLPPNAPLFLSPYPNFAYGPPRGRRGGGGFMGPRSRPTRGAGERNGGRGREVGFESEFDFEKNNEEMVKAMEDLKVKEEAKKTEGSGEGVGEKSTEEPNGGKVEEKVYYKKDDFYDAISCEASEKGKGPSSKPDWKAERKMNAETFGLAPERYRNRPSNGGWYYNGPMSGAGFYNPRYNNGGYGYNMRWGGNGGSYGRNQPQRRLASFS